MKSVLLLHADLDPRLARFALQIERFARASLRLAAALDARGIDLEIRDPGQWRGSRTPARVPLEDQFYSEIRSFRRMDREEELRLALRLEFARLRMLRAQCEHGALPAHPGSGAELPRAVRRRRDEWHALRLELVERNLYLLPIAVERFRQFRTERADMIQAGVAALFRAADRFDWRRGVLFRTYATHWLNEGFRAHLHNFRSTVRVPVNVQKSVKRINAAIQRLGNVNASASEIARETGLRPRMIALARAATSSIRSLDSPLDPFGNARTLASELAMPGEQDPCCLAAEEQSPEDLVEAALSCLSERERRAVELRFGIGCARPHIYSEIAEAFGVSQERVRQILRRAISRMRTPPLRRLLESLLG